MSNNNRLNYTKLTYTDILKTINDKLNADPRFENFRESGIAQTIIELFTANTDLTNYYIERRAEEQFLETCKLKSSAIQLSKQLGYVPTRAIPAKAQISITLKGGGVLKTYADSGDLLAGNFVEFLIYNSFSHGGVKFVLENSYKYIFSELDVTNIKNDPDFKKVITYGLLNDKQTYNIYKDEDVVNVDDTITINIRQGEIKYQDVLGINNKVQVNQPFQVHKLDDTTYSNIYGDDDWSNKISRIALSDNDTNVYKNKAEQEDFIDMTIDRRSLLKTDEILDSFDTAKPIVYVRSALDETIEMVFGDDLFAMKGLGSKANIFTQYLSTIGAMANEIGTIGDPITYNNSIYLNNEELKNITANFEFNLSSNITNGTDFESLDSIKVNASGIFYALDRCVTSDDYVSVLKSITNPVDIINALAWGEQEEGGSIAPIVKLFNVALFTCIGELYKQDSISGVWQVKESDGSIGGEMYNSVLDDVDIFDTYSRNNYFNLLVREDAPGQSLVIENENENTDYRSKLGQVYNVLKSKSQMTVKSVYVSPIVHDFEIIGDIFCNSFADATQLMTDIKNSIYNFLNLKADFNTNIYKSNLVELIEDFDGTNYANIELQPTLVVDVNPINESFTTFLQNNQSIIAYSETVPFPEDFFIDTQNPIDVAYNIRGMLYSSFVTLMSTLDESTWQELKELSNPNYITEEWFNKTFIKTLFDSLNDLLNDLPSEIYTTYWYVKEFINSTQWNDFMMDLHRPLHNNIKNNMMYTKEENKVDNIINYSLKIELAKVTFNANVLYKQGI